MAARTAGADSFTCRCGRAFPVTRGAFNQEGRALCPPCLSRDSFDNSGKIIGILVGVGVSVALLCWRLDLF